jgi:XamI restriction endonuclease
MVKPPRWTPEQLDAERSRSIEFFRRERMQEPLDQYLRVFDQYATAVEHVLTESSDLDNLDDAAIALLTDKSLLEAFRYLSGPPISADDLKTLAEAALSPGRLRSDPEMTRRVVEVVRFGLDRKRFPWIALHRKPTDVERSAAVLASAALMASSHVTASRRNEGKSAQESLVDRTLGAAGLTKTQPRPIETLNQAPAPGQFCRETLLGTRKADFVIGLWDHRIMAIECKVSNSAVNSVKRLNNDAAAKAEAWLTDFGTAQIVPCAMLGGVYKLHNLVDAQTRGLTLFWAHELDELTRWIASTRK